MCGDWVHDEYPFYFGAPLLFRGRQTSPFARGAKAILPTSTQSSHPTSGIEPGYMKLLRSAELEARARHAFRRIEHCDLCARYCRVNRLVILDGAVCSTGERAVVHSFGPIMGRKMCCGVGTDRARVFSVDAICAMSFAKTGKSATSESAAQSTQRKLL